MYRKFIPTLFALLLAATATKAQQVFAEIGFATRFDNREYSGTRFADDSRTFFGARLTPQIGLRWDRKNSLVLGADLFQDFGDEDCLTDAAPLIYYRFETKKVRAAAGIFSRELLRGDYGEAFFDRSYLFYHNRIQGLMGSYRGKTGFVELTLDWIGKQSDGVREQFRILSAGRYDKGGGFYGGYALSLQHFAKTSNPDEGEGVVDDILVNPFVGVRFRALFDFDIRLGYLQGLGRDRIAENGWETPKGGMLTFRMSWKGLSLEDELYVGQNTMPLYAKYGPALYCGNAFFRTASEHLYNRTEIGYGRRFFRRTLGVKAALRFECDGKGVGTSQVVEIDVRLHKHFKRKN